MMDTDKIMSAQKARGADFESGNIDFVVVGIGLNLYKDSDTLPPELQKIAGALYTDREAATQPTETASPQ